MVDQAGQLDMALDRAATWPGPVVLDLRIPAADEVYPMVPAGAGLSEMWMKAPGREGGSMIRSESDNGGPPLESGPSPEVVIVLSDRLDALERALGTVRRRGMSLKVYSLSRQDDELVLTLRGDSRRDGPRPLAGGAETPWWTYDK